MAVPAGTTQTYTRIGIREDLSNLITRIQQNEAVFSMSISDGKKAESSLFDWQTDDLKTASGTNAHIEGDDTAIEAANSTVRLNNYTQIMKKSAGTSGTADAVTTAGRDKEHNYQILLRSEELVQDMETRFVGSYAKNAGAPGVARETASLEAWVKQSNRGVGGVDPSGTGSTTATDGTQRAFTEAMLKDVHQKCWAAGGKPTLLMVGGLNKQVASGFAGIATKFRESKGTEQMTIMAAADVYVGDFGTINIVPNNLQRNRSALLIEPRRFKKRFLRRPGKEDLAKTGDSRKTQILVEVGLECSSPKASGVIADLT
jgi:Family of unknown function (DUF5309)